MIPQAKLDALSLDTLMELNRLVVQTIKDKRAREGRLLKWKLVKGDHVTYKAKGGVVCHGHVDAIRVSKATVVEISPEKGKRWIVPLGSLTIHYPDKPKAESTLPQF